jgi:hypothetical protein
MNSTPHAQTITDAFGHLVVMLRSEFDDVASSAAQSIAALSASARVREALGRCAAEEDAAAAARLQAAAAAAAAGGPTPAPVLGLFEALTSRAVNPAASPESRTVCALALAKCALDVACARALFRMGAPWVLLDALTRVPIAAPLSALRRESLRAVLHIVSALDEDARTAVRASVGLVSPAGSLAPESAGVLVERLTRPPFSGDVGEFNALAATLLGLLQGPGGGRGSTRA